MSLLLGLLVAMSVTMALIPPLMKAAGRWQFLDQPSARKVHSTPIPRIGGIAMAVGALLAVVVAGNLATPMPAVIAGLLVLVAFGVWDDRNDLRPEIKLAGQVIAVAIVMVWGGVAVDSVTFAQRYELAAWVAVPLTAMFLIGVTNAVNLADGLDGLAGGTTLLSLAGIAMLAFTSDNMPVAIDAVVLIGAIFGFLRFNTHPARIFMGDGGSQMLGFAAGVLSIMLTQDARAPLSAALPLLLLGIPVIDTLWVMTRRILAGHSPFRADRNHVHHRLLDLGFEHHEAVILIYVAQSLWFVAAWYLRYESDALILSVFVGSAAAIVMTLIAAQRSGWHLRPALKVAPGSVSASLSLWIEIREHVPKWTRRTLLFGVTTYATLVAIKSDASTPDVRATMFALAGILTLALAVRRQALEPIWVEKAIFYVAAVIAIYLDASQQIAAMALHEWRWAFFGALTFVICLRFYLLRDRRLSVTPLDVLIVFAAVAIPNLPGSMANHLTVGESVAKLVVLFYTLEALLDRPDRSYRLVSLGCIVFLLTAALRAAV
jgi:UDP-GlcNAc:undecaprenyl-phosphate/decaprenyl-phosphate GlcNAc-1-phosphate transferase